MSKIRATAVLLYLPIVPAILVAPLSSPPALVAAEAAAPAGGPARASALAQPGGLSQAGASARADGPAHPGAPAIILGAAADPLEAFAARELERYLQLLQGARPRILAPEWGELKVDRSVMDLPLKVAGKEYARGLGTHARSDTVWDLGGEFRRFRAFAGVDDGAAPGGRPEVIVRVSLDRGGGWERVWESPRMKLGDAPAEIDLDVSGARKLRLEGDPAGDYHWDHIDLIAPRLER